MTVRHEVTPRATYRLQFHKGFGFDRAASLAPYLGRLGISHVYASPYLKARPSSTHGYDIVDHDALNPELGDQAAFDRMNAAFAACGLKQILDFVPNHMGVGGADNPLWLDMLEWGQDSDRAGWFDIDWDPDNRYLRDKVLVPYLGDQYGAVLESGGLELRFDMSQGSFAVWAYGQHKLPICPLHYGRILGDAHPDLERLGDFFAAVPAWRPNAGRRADQLKAELAALVKARADVREAVSEAVAQMNGGPEGDTKRSPLDALIQDQNWRVAHFRVAADDINYRRFFDVNELAGLRMELPDVFDHAHKLVFRLLRDGILDGLRIDHIDGLLDPKSYLLRLRAAAGEDFYLVVEKILARHESLRDSWPVDGTTGYEVTNLLLGVLIDPQGEEGFTQIYREFTGDEQRFATIIRDSKTRIMENEMVSELNVLARDAARVARQNPFTADFTRNILHRALRQIIACFPVYRTYIDTVGIAAAEDRRDLDWAVAQAARTESELDPSIFDFLAKLLSGDLVAQPRSGFSRHSVLRFAMKLQQYSGPVMAKGLEDTAFYRYNRFLALNEVGGNPEQFGVSLAAFHRANRIRAERWPHAMLTSSTHDTKRGEDTRARLAVLSEMPEEWGRQVQGWSRLLRARDGAAQLDRNDEYAFYQLLIGSCPLGLLEGDVTQAERVAYLERLKIVLTKSLREAKLRSSWSAPNEAYETLVLGFAERALDAERSGPFWSAFTPFAARLARLGALNSLVQTVLKLTLPGVPDIYQGSELFDLSLVDPDNRRPVDYALRARLIDDVENALADDREGAMKRFMLSWQDGRFKLAVIVTLLAHRRACPHLYADGDYEALTSSGDDTDRICAFSRRHGKEAMIVAVARFPARREAMPAASLSIGEKMQPGAWQDLLTGRTIDPGSDRLFEILPAAVLVRAES